MLWSESLVKCANRECDKMIVRKFKMDDRWAWMEDAESSCCCTDNCHGAHLEQVRAELVKDRRAQRSEAPKDSK